jgi:hypothetical protein
MSTFTFSRRRALQTLAALPVTAPLARALASPPGQAPKRLVLLMQTNGTQQSKFWPAAAEAGAAPRPLSSPILDSLFNRADGSDNGLRAKTNIVRGVYVPWDSVGTNANEHDMGFCRMFTGAQMLNKGGQPWGGAASVDQILASDWDVDTLTTAVVASSVQPYPKAGYDHRRSFSYLGPATLRYPLLDPVQVYRKIFATSSSTDDVRRRLAARQSVLDAVKGNLTEVAGRLGRDDAGKLDRHLSAVRDIERRLSATIAGRSAGVTCASPPAAPPDLRAMNRRALLSGEEYIPELVDRMTDLIVAALTCGFFRIATLQMGFAGAQWTFWWQGIGIDCHEYVAHADGSDEGSSPENTARVVLMNQYYAKQVARLGTALDAVPDGDGRTVLDNTLVVWANELGRGDHNQANVPIVLLGLVGRGLPAGGRVIDAGTQPFNRLGCTILNLFGHTTPGFGDLPDCGVFQGLL